MTLITANISAHITSRTSTPFVLMHIVHLLSGMILHREYIPFIPLRSPKPEGPLDPPLFPSDDYSVPEGFWEQSARDLFKSAREVIDLLRICQEWGVLVETPIVGFATYTAAFTGKFPVGVQLQTANTRQVSMPSTSRGWTRMVTCAKARSPGIRSKLATLRAPRLHARPSR